MSLIEVIFEELLTIFFNVVANIKAVIDAIKNGAYRNSSFMTMVALNLMLNFLPNVAWQAHLGGLVAGFIFYMMFDNYKVNKSYIFVILIVIIALVIKMYIV